jgi:hypothetical protein
MRASGTRSIFVNSSNMRIRTVDGNKWNAGNIVVNFTVLFLQSRYNLIVLKYNTNFCKKNQKSKCC